MNAQDAARPGSSSGSSTAASSATSRRTSSTSSSSSRARRRPRSSPRRSATCTTRSTPGLEDFGDVMLRGNGGQRATSAWTGSRPTASTPGATAGSPSSAPTASSRSARTSTSRGRPGGSHLFLVDQKETRYVDCAGRRRCPTARSSWTTCSNRTETAMPQAHCFLAMELALEAQKQAKPVALAG